MPLTSVRSSTRRGFTIAELLVVLVLSGIVFGALWRVLDRQQRYYQGVGDMMQARGQMRQATAVLPIDLRSVSTIGGDITVFSDSAIELRSQVASSVVCEIIGTTQVAIAPLNVASGQTLTSVISTIRHPDLAFVYDDGATKGNVDDTWQQLEINDVQQNAGDCGASPLVPAADAGKMRTRLTFGAGTPISPTIVVGTPIRIMRRVRYSLYKAADNNWYLGFSDWNGAYTAPEAVAGPYRAYDDVGGSGIGFQYYDESGVATTTAANIARIDLVVRTQPGRIKVDGLNTGTYYDSVAVSVAIRNRS
jgi:prepilin-type N-terminal cleavage/methylation domain-containing protein